MPDYQKHIFTNSRKLSEMFSGKLSSRVMRSTRSDGFSAKPQSACYDLNIPSNTEVVVTHGIVSTDTLRPGDHIVACGGSRKISNVISNTSLAPMFRIERGVLNPRQPIMLRADQVIRIIDARVLRLFGMRTALLRVEDLAGLAGITSLGLTKHVNLTIRLVVADAVFVEALWVEAVDDDANETDLLHLPRDEVRLLLGTQLPQTRIF